MSCRMLHNFLDSHKHIFFSQYCSLLWQCHVFCFNISICTSCYFFVFSLLWTHTKEQAVPTKKKKKENVPCNLLPLQLLPKALCGHCLPYLQPITGSAQDQISFVYIMFWLTHYICASTVLPPVFTLQMCATIGAVAQKKVLTLTSNFLLLLCFLLFSSR